MELRPLALSSKPPSFRRQSASGSAGGLFGRREQAFEPLRNDEFHAEDDDERYRNPETQSDHPLLRSPRGEVSFYRVQNTDRVFWRDKQLLKDRRMHFEYQVPHASTTHPQAQSFLATSCVLDD